MTAADQKELHQAAMLEAHPSRWRSLAAELFALRAWLFGAVLYFVVMRHLQGIDPARPDRMWIALHSIVSGAGAFCIAALGLLRRREARERLVFGVLWFVTLSFLFLMNKKFVVSHIKRAEAIALMHVLVKVAGVLALAALPAYWFGFRRAAAVALAAAVAILVLDRAGVLIASPSPRIDVFTLAREAAAALWRGENPYAADYSNLYENTELDLGYSPGYNYLPVMLMSNALSAKLFGDVRVFYLGAEALCAFFMLRFARAFSWTWPLAFLFALLWSSNSLSYQIVEKWNDSIVLAGVLGMLAMLAERRWLLAGIAFGLAAASKQYAPLAIVPLGVWFWRLGNAAYTKRFAIGAALGGGLISLPFLINQPQWMFARAVFHFARTPFRGESLSLLNWCRIVVGLGKDSWVIRVSPFVGLAFGLGAACAIALRCRAEDDHTTNVHRLITALLFVWASFFHSIKQSFLNYHYFFFSVGLLLLVSMLVVRPRDPAAASHPAPSPEPV